MIEKLSLQSAQLSFTGSGDSGDITNIVISYRECRCDVFRKGKLIPSDVPHVILSVPADEESKAIVTEWIDMLKRSNLVEMSGEIVIDIDSTYFKEFFSNVSF